MKSGTFFYGPKFPNERSDPQLPGPGDRHKIKPLVPTGTCSYCNNRGCHTTSQSFPISYRLETSEEPAVGFWYFSTPESSNRNETHKRTTPTPPHPQPTELNFQEALPSKDPRRNISPSHVCPETPNVRRGVKGRKEEA